MEILKIKFELTAFTLVNSFILCVISFEITDLNSIYAFVGQWNILHQNLIHNGLIIHTCEVN